jgi:hypothetical protein
MRMRTIAALQLPLLLPAALFMLALAGRNLTPAFEVTNIAQRVVAWYAARMWTLWVFLLAMPFTVLISGTAALWYKNRELVHVWKWLLGGTTVAAGGILVIVVLHMLAN